MKGKDINRMEDILNYLNGSFNLSKGFNKTDLNDLGHFDLSFLILLNWIAIGIGLPLTLIVIGGVCSQVKSDQDSPIYIINLLLSDLIQFCIRIPLNSVHNILMINNYLILIATANVGFLMCISFDRYLVIISPLWNRFRSNIMTSVVVCIVVWALPLLFLLMYFLHIFSFVFLAGFLLVPFPFFIFFLVGSIKALSGDPGVPADVKRQIVAIQVVVLIIYTLLFLPILVWFLVNKFDITLFLMALVQGGLSPLADTVLYLIIQKSLLDKFLTSLQSC